MWQPNTYGILADKRIMKSRLDKQTFYNNQQQ